MPAVSMAAIRASLKRDLDADFGDVIYFSKVMEPRHEFLTANNQTPYVCTFFDLRRGPMVLEVPAASDRTVFFGSAIDSWEVPLADIGGTGDDAGKGGKDLFLPPGNETKPPDGYFVVPSETVFIHIGLRPISIGKGTPADAVAYSQLLKAYPLAAAKPVTRYIDGYPKAWKTLPTFDVSYFQLLADAIADEPPQPKDAAMLAMLTSIGIEKGKPFLPDATRAKLLTAAVREAEATMNDGFMNHSFEPFWPGRQWQGNKLIPTDTAGRFEALFRFYGPEKPLFDKTWVLPDIEKIS